MLLLSSADFLERFALSKNSLGTISVSNSLDPDQDQHSVGADLGPICLQKLQQTISRKRVS